MTCGKFKAFERGRMSREAWELHAGECPDCRAEAERDRRLSEKTARLRKPLSAPELWNRIETALQAEAEKTAAVSGGRDVRERFFTQPAGAKLGRWLVPAAAVALLAAAAAVVFLVRSPARLSESGLLDRQALARVDAREKEYRAAIDDLEKRTRPLLAEMDPSLMSLYQDRLSVIDAQIGKCREALDRNPTNAHIRRYLLAALQDKKDTLAEVLGS